MRPSVVLFVCWFLLIASVSPLGAKEKPPTNPDKGDIVLAGIVLTPGDGTSTGVPGLQALQGALVILEGTKHATTTDARGLFIFTEAPEGEVTVVITCEGYQGVKRRAKVSKGADTPETLRVEMLPLGTSVTKGALSGPGTLYAAFVPRQAEESTGGGLMNYLSVLALGVDVIGSPRELLAQDPNDPGWNPVTDLSHFLMVWPSQAPARTSFQQLDGVPIWPCFDKEGDVLYVSTTAGRIEVLDARRGGESLGHIPFGPEQKVTGLALSPDGSLLWASVMSRSPSLFAIDTTTHQVVARLAIELEMMVPTAVETSGDRLYVTLVSGLDRSLPGTVVAVDPATGALRAQGSVGTIPTDAVLAPDGSALYVANCGSGTVSVLDPHTLQPMALLQAGVAPVRLAVTPDSLKLLVTNRGSGTVSLWDRRDPASARLIKVGQRPTDIVLSLDADQAFVSNGADGTISTIDLKSAQVVRTTHPNPRANPLGLAVRPRAQ